MYKKKIKSKETIPEVKQLEILGRLQVSCLKCAQSSEEQKAKSGE